MKDLILVDNFKSWIDNQWIDFLLHNHGDVLPKDFKDLDSSASIDDVIWDEHVQSAFQGWDRTKIKCHSFRKHNFPFEVHLPIASEDKKFEWFFIKLLPGMGQPIHMDVPPNGRKFVDRIPVSDPSVTRYWMPLQDYEKGHVFIYEEKLICNYKKGDLFRYHDEMAWHGPCNTSNNIRLTFNFTIW